MGRTHIVPANTVYDDYVEGYFVFLFDAEGRYQDKSYCPTKEKAWKISKRFRDLYCEPTKQPRKKRGT